MIRISGVFVHHRDGRRGFTKTTVGTPLFLKDFIESKIFIGDYNFIS
jgi:hypothetical protein